MKKEGKKRRKGKHDNQDDNEKEQLIKYKKKGKKIMRDDLGDEKKITFKKRGQQQQKRKVR